MKMALGRTSHSAQQRAISERQSGQDCQRPSGVSTSVAMDRVEYSHRWNPFPYFSMYRLFLRVSAEGERYLISIALVIRGCSWPSPGVLLPGIVWKSLKMCVISVEVKKNGTVFLRMSLKTAGRRDQVDRFGLE